MTKALNIFEEPRVGFCCRVRHGLGAIIAVELLINFLVISAGLYLSTHVTPDRKCFSPFLMILLNLFMTYCLHHGRNTENHRFLIPFMIWKVFRMIMTTLFTGYFWRNVHIFEQNLHTIRQFLPHDAVVKIEVSAIGLAVIATLFLLMEIYFISIVTKAFSWYRFKAGHKEQVEKEGLEVTYRVPVPTMPPAAPPPYIHVDKTDPEYKY